jgi:hypothetical protein
MCGVFPVAPVMTYSSCFLDRACEGQKERAHGAGLPLPGFADVLPRLLVPCPLLCQLYTCLHITWCVWCLGVWSPACERVFADPHPLGCKTCLCARLGLRPGSVEEPPIWKRSLLISGSCGRTSLHITREKSSLPQGLAQFHACRYGGYCPGYWLPALPRRHGSRVARFASTCQSQDTAVAKHNRFNPVAALQK